MDEIGWLIEHQSPSGPLWFGASHGYRWTNNAIEGMRFCRKKDAQALIDFLGVRAFPESGRRLSVTEHMWTDGAALEGSSLAEENSVTDDEFDLLTDTDIRNYVKDANSAIALYQKDIMGKTNRIRELEAALRSTVQGNSCIFCGGVGCLRCCKKS